MDVQVKLDELNEANKKIEKYEEDIEKFEENIGSLKEDVEGKETELQEKVHELSADRIKNLVKRDRNYIKQELLAKLKIICTPDSYALMDEAVESVYRSLPKLEQPEDNQ